MHKDKCSSCGTAAGIIKCKDCSCGSSLKCPQCIVSLHRTLPLHRVEVSCFQSPDENCLLSYRLIEMEQQILRQGLPSKPWTPLSAWPLWSALSVSSPWPEELHRLRHLWPSLYCRRLLSLWRPTTVNMDPAAP